MCWRIWAASTSSAAPATNAWPGSARPGVMTRRAPGGKDKVRRFFQAESWRSERRVIARARATTLGSDTRFIVTSIPGGRAKHLYETVYCARGRMENLIKEHKLYLRSDRTSGHRREANRFRIFLHTAAYWLMLRPRGAVARSGDARAHQGAARRRSRIHRKGKRNKPLSDREKKGNKTRSRVRVRVEHVFGARSNDMGGPLIRSIGLVRAKARIGLRNLACNMRRAVQLDHLDAAPG